ncbi:MAG TPA: ATP-binding protein [Methylomirabilota bacterium]|nr:ATP-binding protein [Methylomirabilota bacterium]
MKLRSHLLVLVLGAVLPVLAFSAAMTVVFWRQQRDAFEERFLERVHAVAFALDRELAGHARALQVLARSPRLARGDLRGFYEEASAVRAEQPLWATIILVQPDGTQRINLRRRLGEPLPRSGIDPALLQAVARSEREAVSPLVTGAVSSNYTTAVMVPVRQHGTVPYILLAAIDVPGWLQFLSSYPVARDATMTLLDQNGIIVARTLNHEQWVGKRPAAELSERSRRLPEAAYRSMGLEGQWFYSAHSRSPFSGWTVATGVPAAGVEAELRDSTIAIVIGALAAAALAVGLALLFGRRVARPVVALARSATTLATGQPPAPATPTKIAELAEVNRAFDDASSRLRTLLAAERSARDEAEAANRMKDEFLATLSHELRTPLNAVFGWARMLRRGDARQDTLRHGLEVIERNAVAQAKLIEDLLDVSRITTGKMRLQVRAVDMPAVVEAAIDSMRQAAAAREIRVQPLLDPAAGPVIGDPDRLQQVAWNLLSNAIKFTPKGGRVQVSLRRIDSHVELAVSDTGQGIAPELLPHIFERFRQGDSSSTRQHGGLGIGLALVRHLVELHGGTVSVRSAGVDAGTTFVVRLPISLAVEPPAARRGHPTVSDLDAPMVTTSLKGLRLLLVDDERDTLDLFAQVLGSAGAQIETATSTEEAQACFARRPPDVLVADVEMPGADGYALIERVRALAPSRGGDVPAVAVTAYGRVEDRVRLLAAGFNMHVPKPVEPAELITVVATLARRPGSDGVAAT